mmetsp:Transcript_19247/g.47597  ORF Transcript_19247/g.47597 Transcript_19247/m.47597 type:complete len:474 (-) Transcript_19247:214-1635(-)
MSEIRKRKGFSPTAEPTMETPKDLSDDTPSKTDTKFAMSGSQVAKDESRTRKTATRILSGLVMISFFTLCVYSGHLYLCFLVSFCEVLLFRELVKVRYSANYEKIQDTIPLFRTTQWLWFSVAIFYTYADFISDTIQNNSHLQRFWPFSKYFPPLAFCLYSFTFVLTISTMQVGHIRFQVNQLCWTVLVLCMTVGQLKYIMHNIFNGLFWFVFPILLVTVNDIMAYVFGRTCGKKFIRRSFIPFSPNKTWEGFIGGGICTVAISWYLSRAFAEIPWMICPTNEFRWYPDSLDCTPHHIFQRAQSIIPAQVFEVLPQNLVKLIPGIIEYCSVEGEKEITRCVSGEPTQSFHHFELIIRNVYPIQIHALWIGLFASCVAPFGGFLASAIKRAYGIKDFDSVIPGHGGLTDRFDCQFLMALYTWVHYNTFVRMATVSAPKLFYMYSMLSDEEKRVFLEAIGKETGRQVRNRMDDFI